ncbi:MAG: hypothetical protein U9N36_01780 [Euryarchaeota archaeon]|nr:hypothetical protein [Euryarchaeota archaeon]
MDILLTRPQPDTRRIAVLRGSRIRHRDCDERAWDRGFGSESFKNLAAYTALVGSNQAKDLEVCWSDMGGSVIQTGIVNKL